MDIKTLPKKNYDPIFKNGQSGAVLKIRRPAAKKRLNSILYVTAAIDNNSNLSEKSPKKKINSLSLIGAEILECVVFANLLFGTYVHKYPEKINTKLRILFHLKRLRT